MTGNGLQVPVHMPSEERLMHRIKIHKALDMSKKPGYERDMKTEWTVACTCGWHTHIVYPARARAAFAWHLEELERLEQAFTELVTAVRYKITRAYPAEREVFQPIFEPLLKSLDVNSEDSRASFIDAVVHALEEGDVDYDLCYTITQALHVLYRYIEKPLTKKMTTALTAEALFGKDGPNWGGEEPERTHELS